MYNVQCAMCNVNKCGRLDSNLAIDTYRVVSLCDMCFVTYLKNSDKSIKTTSLYFGKGMDTALSKHKEVI